MNRIDNIVAFAERKEEAERQKEIARIDRIEKYKEKIHELKPRIDELLKVGNACLEYNIPLEGKEWGGHEGYDTHQFITNSWSHLLGFVSRRDQFTRSRISFTHLGIMGGGACNYNLETDGNKIEVSGDIEYILHRFIKDFDEFEAEFYNYVDKITA